jgi:hypothetical protein
MPPVNIAKLEMAKGFAKVWTYKGLAVPLDDAQLQFACDFTNMIFTSFFEQQAKAMVAAKQAAEQKAKSVLVVA